MASLSRSKTKAQYSWWWDSHISPKNSKWLKENLTDMDSKVKTMIKLIEVDEDTFVRRAEVYFRRRPELMKLVEEFYRAYRALAERYDHATGIIRDAQKTMSEAFPDQVPSLMIDDFDPHTPEMKASDFSFVKEVETLAGRKARKGLNFQEVESEAGVGMKKSDLQALKDALAKLEAEKEDGLLQYQQAIGKLSKLESEVSQTKEDSRGLNERARKAEAEVESLKETILRVETEREDSLIQYQQCLSRISNFEKENGVLKDELTQVKAEKEALLAKYLESLEKIASLENKLLLADDYASRTSEQAERAEKQIESLKETIARLSEEKEASIRKYEECLEKISSLQSEIAAIQKELSEKDEELRKLWTSVEEERMRFAEAENSFQSLQNVHSEVQEELRLVATELQKKVELLKDMEIQNQHLQDKVQKALDENKSLYEVNLSSAVTIKSMQGDIIGLKDQKGKLEQNLELQVDEHSKLKESSEKNEAEIASLVEKLAVMEKLMEKNELLENSLADLEAELDATREKMKALEESKSMLASDKTTLISQLEMTTMNLEELSERNSFLENSLFDVNGELEMLRVKSKNLEDSCRLLVTEKQTLASQLEITQSKFEDLGKRHADLEQRYTGLEEERESTLHRVEELRGFLEVEKQERDNSTQLNQTKIASLESEICVLQEVGEHVRNEFEEELDKAVNAQFDIFILRKSIHDLKDKNTSLMGYCEKLQEASKLSEKLIFELENTSYEQKEELRLLSGEIKGLRKGMFQLLGALQSYASPEENDYYENEDQKILHYIIVKLDDVKTSLCEAVDENHALIIEKSVLLAVLWQLKRDVEDLNDVIIFLRQEIEIRNNHILVLQKEMHTLLESNEELILKVREGNQKEVTLLAEIQIFRGKLFNLQGAYDDLKQEKHDLEDECSCIVGDVVVLDNLSVIFKNIISEKAREFMELNENYKRLGYDNGVLVEKVRVLSSELQKGKDTVELWETVAWAFFSELQSANVRETLIKEKLYELMRYYKILEEENCSKGTGIVDLHRRVGVLEGENSEIKARLAADFSAILSLQYSLASLEKHTGLQRKPHETNEEQKEEDQQFYDLSEDKAIAGNVDLHDVRERIQAVEKAVIELKQHKEERYSRTLSRRGSKRFSKRFGLNSEEISRSGSQIDGAERGDELLMKDIMLDQVSDPSSDGKKKKSIRKMVSDDLELWETVDGGGSIDLSVGKPEKDVKDNMSSRPSSVLTVEKELLWINDEQRQSSKRFPQPEGDHKRKFLERLASDVQKLTNLQMTVQDLKEKLDIVKSAECDGIKDQLVETENNILNLFDYGEKLMKRIEKSTSFNATSSTDSISEGGSGRRRRCSEQAQRISEKIGRLQLQVQKIQFSMLKYDSNKVGGKSGPKAPEFNTRVLLRDYLYGRGPRTPKRRLKTRLCGCMRPSTMED